MAVPNPDTNPLSNLVNVIVQVSNLSAPRPTFNRLLILGTTDVISTDDRVEVYQSLAAMLSDGFAITDPEYVAAQIYFSQRPTPQYLYIGRQGTGSPAETCLEAIQACRAKNYDWYIAVALEAVEADHLLIAAWAEAETVPTIYAFTTDDADILNGVASPANLGLYLQGLEYTRTIWQYATTQSGAYPNNIYAIVAAMGYACGQNTGLANSAFTLMFKNEVGIATEPLSSTEIDAICGAGPDSIGVNGNVYLSYGNYYNILQKGVMCNGVDFYETVGLDMLTSDIQLAVMDLLYGSVKVPQTNPGVTAIIHKVNEACVSSVVRGFIAPGVWLGVDILNLKYGDTLPNGFLVQAESVSTLTQAERDAGKVPPIYIAVKLAGAVKYVLIEVNVNR